MIQLFGERNGRVEIAPGRPFETDGRSAPAHVGGLEPLRALGHLELDLVALRQALEALRLNGIEMHEHVLAALLRDESITLRIVEPLDRTPCHWNQLPLSRLAPR